MQEDYITFDKTKFMATVHYICAQCKPDELGNVKLHKILYFADMIKFAGSGEPLTGADYIKQQFGPTARHLSATLDRLAAEKKLHLETVEYFGFQKKQYVSLVAPDTSKLSNFDAQLLNEVIEFVIGRSAKEISALSHNVAWETARMGQRIPYAASLSLHPVEVTEEDIAAGSAEIRRLGPMIEAESRASSHI
jgi:uncharacterized phage-associated protein